jgi:hypothetical protein
MRVIQAVRLATINNMKQLTLYNYFNEIRDMKTLFGAHSSCARDLS